MSFSVLSVTLWLVLSRLLPGGYGKEFGGEGSVRQCQYKARWSVGEADESHVAAMLASQTPGCRQTETAAAAGAATAVKGIEEMLARAGGRPGPLSSITRLMRPTAAGSRGRPPSRPRLLRPRCVTGTSEPYAPATDRLPV